MLKKALCIGVLIFTCSTKALPPDHLCVSEEIVPSSFFANIIGAEKAADLVKIRKKCIDFGEDFNLETSGADAYVLDVQIGTLKHGEFLDFKAKFGNFSQVPYEPSKTYNLVDFLPPAMQAMVNKNFKTNRYPEFDELFPNISNDEISWMFRSGLSSSSNCWNTVIENVRLMANQTDAATGPYHLYWPGRWEVSETLFDNEFSTEVPRSEARFGDIVLIYIEKILFDEGKPGDSSIELQHASVVLNDQLVYEKVDSSDFHPYRIGLFDETYGKIKKLFSEGLINDEFQKQTLKMQIRRFDSAKFAASEQSKALQYDLVEGQFEHEDETAKAQYEATIALLPKALIDLYLTVGCETGFGGGCMQLVTAVQRVEVWVDQETGYGILRPISMPDAFTEKYTGGTQVLKRFVEVPYLN